MSPKALPGSGSRCTAPTDGDTHTLRTTTDQIACLYPELMNLRLAATRVHTSPTLHCVPDRRLPPASDHAANGWLEAMR